MTVTGTARVRRTVALLLTAATSLGAAACVRLPTSGPVERAPAIVGDRGETASYFVPPGPRRGDSPLGIAQGFLIAMQANPISTSIAKRFLTDAAASTWRPQRRTLIYPQFPVAEQDGRVRLSLDGAVALDPRGRWLGPQDRQDRTLRIVREQGQWRIDNPPNALLVPDNYVEDRFARASLMFFDPSARTLVPEPVFYPRGSQGATSLVAGLLRGPVASGVERSFAPPGTSLDLSVTVSGSGRAEVPVSPQLLTLDPPALRLFAAQLSATLGQVSEIDRVVVTSDGAPVVLGPRGNEAPRAVDPTLSPSYAPAGDAVFGVTQSRVGRFRDARFRPVAGPLGTGDLAVADLAPSLDARYLAAVTADGGSLVVSDLARGGDTRTVLIGDVAAPHWDRFGDLWAIDRTADGAVVERVDGGRASAVGAPGIDGEDVAAFLASRDGSRLVAAVRSSKGDRLVVSRVRRTDTGEVSGLTRAKALPTLDSQIPTGSRILDLAWSSDVGLDVLVRTDTGLQIDQIAVDGSPLQLGGLPLNDLPRGTRSLIASPDADSGLRVLTGAGRVFQLAPDGGWVRLPLPSLSLLTRVG